MPRVMFAQSVQGRKVAEGGDGEGVEWEQPWRAHVCLPEPPLYSG